MCTYMRVIHTCIHTHTQTHGNRKLVAPGHAHKKNTAPRYLAEGLIRVEGVLCLPFHDPKVLLAQRDVLVRQRLTGRACLATLLHGRQSDRRGVELPRRARCRGVELPRRAHRARAHHSQDRHARNHAGTATTSANEAAKLFPL
jgi:hypothetical protein